MLRQRSTVYYTQQPKSSFSSLSASSASLSAANLIEFLNSTDLELKLPLDKEGNEKIFIEDKFTIPLAQPIEYILQLRIQSKNVDQDEDDSSIDLFPFDYSSGLNVYVTPKTAISKTDLKLKEKILKEINLILADLIGTEIDEKNWNDSLNTLHYYDLQPGKLNTSSTFLNTLPNKQLDSTATFDLIYNDFLAPKQMILRQLHTKVEKVSYTTTDNVYKEIGLFAKDPSFTLSNDDIALSGMRVIFDGRPVETNGDNRHKTLFHVKPRHRYLTSKVKTQVKIPSGLHPLLKSTLVLDETNKDELPLQDEDVKECRLYYHLNLNKSLIFDKYQDIPQDSQLHVYNGVENLELPEYKVDGWGNELLFEWNNTLGGSATNQNSDKESTTPLYAPESTEFELKLHSRYQKPGNNEQPYTQIFNAHPHVFYACIVKDAHLLEKLPFDTKKLSRVGGGYEAYFTNDTVFYHLSPDVSKLDLLTVDIPHGVTTFDRVHSITLVTLLLGVLIIVSGIYKKLVSSTKDATRNKATTKSKKE